MFSDGIEFIPSVWSGSYVCTDDNKNISYLLNISKAESGFIGTVGELLIDRHSLRMSGTFASFARVLALQTRDVVSSEILGNNLTNVEINMNAISSVFMTGAIVFRTMTGVPKSCRSEIRRIAGELLKICGFNYFPFCLKYSEV